MPDKKINNKRPNPVNTATGQPLINFKELSQNIDKEKIDKGLMIDPVEEAKLSGGLKDWSAGSQLATDYPNQDVKSYEDYKGYINDASILGRQFSSEDLRKWRANSQSGWEQAGNAIGRVALNIVPQILSSASAMVDIKGYWDAEHAANNEIVNWANSLKEDVDAALPIFEQDANSNMNLGDSGWWFSRGSSLVESIGAFAASGAGAGALVKGVSLLAKGAGAQNLVRAVGLAKTAQGAERIGQASKVLGTAVMMNQAEAVIEASQTYKTVLESRLAKGYSFEDSKKNAAEAAATAMNINRLNIVLNLTSAKLFLTPLANNRQLIKQFSKLAIVKTAGLEAIQEGAEETINFIADKAGTAKGENKEYDLKNAAKDAVSIDGLEAAFLGAIGGAGQTFITKGLRASKYGIGNTVDKDGNRISAVTAHRSAYEAQQKAIEEMKASGVRVTDALMSTEDHAEFLEKFKKAAEQGNPDEISKLQDQLFSLTAMKAFQSGTTQVLEEMITEVAQDPESSPEVKERAVKAQQLLKTLEQIHYNAEGYENVDDIYFNRANAHNLNKVNKELESRFNLTNNDYISKVAQIASKYNFKEVIDGISNTIPIPYSIDSIEDNTGTTKEHKETYNKFLDEVQSLDTYQQVQDIKRELENTQEAVLQNDAAFKHLKSKEVQQQARDKKVQDQKDKELRKQIEEITDISKLEEFRNNTTNPNLQQFIDEKIKTLKANQAAEKNNKKQAKLKDEYLEKINNIQEENKLALIDEINNNQDLSDISKSELLQKLQYQEENNSLEQFGLTSVNEFEVDNIEDQDTIEIEDDFRTPQEEEESIEKQIEDIIGSLMQSNNGFVRNNYGDITFTYTRPTTGSNRAAYLSRQYNQNVDIVNKLVSREEFTNEIQNKQVLNPAFKEGTVITISSFEDYNGEIYDKDSLDKSKMLWQDRLIQIKYLAEQRGIDYKSTIEYINEVPIRVNDSNGNTVFYVHDVSWLTEENIEASPEAIEEDIKKLQKIRKSIIDSTNSITTKITKKGAGVLLRSTENQTVSEAFPEKSGTLAIIKNGNYVAEKSGKVNEVTNKQVPHEGSLVIVAPNETSNVAFPLRKTNLSESEIDIIIEVTRAYFQKDFDSPIIKQVGQKLGILFDSKASEGLKQFLEQYIYLYKTEGNEGLEGVFNNTSSRLKTDTRLITITPNSIEFGRVGINKPNVLSRDFNQFAGNKKSLTEVLVGLKTFLQQVKVNADLNSLQNNSDLLTMVNGEIKTNKYNDWLRSKFESNVFAINVGTNDKPIWSTTIQPTIEFDTSFAEDTIEKQQTSESNPQVKEIEEKQNKLWLRIIALKENEQLRLRNQGLTELLVISEAAKFAENLKEAKEWQALEDQKKELLNPTIESESLANIEEETRAQNVASKLSKENINSEISRINSEIQAANSTVPLEQSEADRLNQSLRILNRSLEIQTETENLLSKLDIIEEDNTDIPINPFTGEPESLDDFNEDDFLPATEEDVRESIQEEAKELLLQGVPLAIQRDFVNYFSSIVIQEGIKQKEIDGNTTINTSSIFANLKKEIIDRRNNLDKLGLKKKVEILDNIILQFNLLNKLTNRNLSIITSNRISENDETFEEGEEGGLVRNVYSDDWSLTLDSKKTASAKLKKFFSNIYNLDENGKVITNALGVPIVIPSNEVYNTLHELLANKPASYKVLLDSLNEYIEYFPWLKSVVNNLEQSTEDIQNEFVSDMTKHHISMEFVMWEKTNKGYSMRIWNSNSSSNAERIKLQWKNNLKGINSQSPIITINDTNDYIFDKAELNIMIDQAKSWETNPATKEDLEIWLGKLGIVLSDKTYKALSKGEFRNGQPISYIDLFKNSKGLIKVINGKLANIVNQNISYEQADFFNDSVIKSLSLLEATYTSNSFSNSFNAGTKSVYTFTNNKWIFNRFRNIISEDQQLLRDLRELSFNQDSLWIDNLLDPNSREITLDQMNLTYLSLEALKKKFTKSRDDRKLNQLTAIEHEVVKLGFFFNNFSESIQGTQMRKVGYFYPTTSDKSGVQIIHQFAKKINLTTKGDIITYSDEDVDTFYKAVVLPEIKRIDSNKKPTTVANNEPNYFYFLPVLNTEKLVDGKTLIDLIKDGKSFNEEVTDSIKNYLQTKFLPKLIQNKIEDWNNLGIIEGDNINFVDSSYINQKGIGSTKQERINYAAADYVFNYAIANAEIFKLFIGDPSQFAKFKSNRSLEQNLEETFTNIGKRLAGDIAPGIELSNSVGSEYIQVFFNDKKIDSLNISDKVQSEYFNRVNKEYNSNYKGLEGSDAQEYTTWKERLQVLKKLGRVTSEQLSTISNKLQNEQNLTSKEVSLVLQPDKPVYVGNKLEKSENIDRRVYIKSSSFPLIPQLTKGFEIDKIRQALEKYESSISNIKSPNGDPLTIRASFNTANKIGGIKNSIDIFDDNGNVLDFTVTESNTLKLSRENFRIQQDVPYKEDKHAINVGTQEMKLLFNNLLDINGFEFEGKEINGKELEQEYLDTYKNLFEYKYNKLRERLSVTEDNKISVEELQKILISEVKTSSGYPINMLAALELNKEYKLDDNNEILHDKEGNPIIDKEKSNKYFKIPLWASPYVDKFESLLTSIITNNIIKQKFEGNSFVLGSQEGFKLQEGLEDFSNINMITVKDFDPVQGLKPLRYDAQTNKLLPAQVLLPFIFRDKQGTLLDIKEFTTINEDGRTILDSNKIPDKLLTLFGFRIPTQGHNSMSMIEIVGFIPNSNLVIAPRDFTKQMGSDFDVDKLYAYMYNHFYEDGKLSLDFNNTQEEIDNKVKEIKIEISKLNKEAKLTELEEQQLNDYINRKLEDSEETTNLLSSIYKSSRQSIANEVSQLINEIKFLNKNYESYLQNRLLDIHNSVLNNPIENVASAITSIDGFGELPELATRLNAAKSKEGTYTILSETYQRSKYINASAGKTGVGNFSLDSTFAASTQGKDLLYLTLDGKQVSEILKTGSFENLREANDIVTSFGNTISKGYLSDKYTLRSRGILDRAKAQNRELTETEKEQLKFRSKIIQSLQSAAVDNEKEQLLDKLNINNNTFDVIRALAMLGFEEKDIMGLINQSIIIEYIDKLSSARSSLEDYKPNIKEDIITSIKDKYDPTNSIIDVEDIQRNKLQNISGEELIKLIEEGNIPKEIKEGETPDINIQQILFLDKFIKLEEVGIEIKRLQSAINSDSKGVPKNLIETSSKMNQVNNISASNIYNADTLLGQEFIEEGFIPTTINGYATYYGTNLANKIFNQFFPYNSEAMDMLYKELLLHTNQDNVSMSKQTEIKRDLFKNIKSYLFSNPQTELFFNEIQVERARLFVDSTDNLSLSSILQKLSKETWFQNNDFLRSLVFDTNKNSDLSRIFFEATSEDNFEDSNLYLGFLNLFSQNKSIGNYNGIDYTTYKLAQDLVTYAYLEGGNQGAKQFLKLLPISYLKQTNLGNYLNEFPMYFESFGGNSELDYNSPSNFIRQYIQNNPSASASISLKDVDTKNKTLKDISNFIPSKEGISNLSRTIINEFGEEERVFTRFVNFYDSSVAGKYLLYEYNDVSREYEKIPVVADDYNFSQYDSESNIVQPVQSKRQVNNAKIREINTSKILDQPLSTISDLNSFVNNNPLNTIGGFNLIENTDDVSQVKSLLRQITNSTQISEDMKVLANKLSSFNFSQGFHFSIKEIGNIKGYYNNSKKTLTINPEFSISQKQFTEILIHELLHVFSSDLIQKWKKGDNSLVESQINSIQDLENLRLRYIEYLKESGDQEELNTFIKAYEKIQLDKQLEYGKITQEQYEQRLTDLSIPDSTIISKEQLSKYYGAIKLEEFLTMSLTDRDFQNHLNKIQDNEVSFFSKFIQSVIEILNSLGLDIKEGSLLSKTIKTSIEIIESTQSTSLEENINNEIDYLPSSLDVNQNYISFVQQMNNYNTKCK